MKLTQRTKGPSCNSPPRSKTSDDLFPQNFPTGIYTMMPPTSWSNASRTRRKPLCILGVLSLAFLGYFVPWSSITSYGHLSTSTHGKPFPNAETLPARGSQILESLRARSSSLPCPSKVTFVITVSKQDIIATASFILDLNQDAMCPIHLLVDTQQLTDIRHILEEILEIPENISLFSARLSTDGLEVSCLHHVKAVRTPWVWIVGRVDANTGKMLNSTEWTKIFHEVPGVEVAVGTRGARLDESELYCTPQTDVLEPVAFLVPPLLAPSSLLLQAEQGIRSRTSDYLWASLGERISRVTGSGFGGVLLPKTSPALEPCNLPHRWNPRGDNKILKPLVDSLKAHFLSPPDGVLQFAFMLPDLESMHLLAPTACRMLQNGHNVHISVRKNSIERESMNSRDWAYVDIGCHLHYYLDTSGPPNHRTIQLTHSIDGWCLDNQPGPRMLIITELDSDFGREQVLLARRLCPGAVAIINLPYGDLQDSEWLSMLTSQEWEAWDTPQIELAVITHDRPWSLTRLLNSIKRAHFFGDAVNIMINLEQTADSETRRISETFSMNLSGGHMGVHHRVVHAGLMVAVVESWYPHGNHTYGVILEDDVELSPMFYAWIKFCVLRYRYNSSNNQSSQLYGISLYQPKVTELRMEGRRPFDPSNIFTELHFEHTHTPYLSQVPCSWGAVYFPEHWREFQRYLSLRLSEHTMPVVDIVVPGLRSNKWSRSWKRFFNEMVFLRGYVSLYPNYDHFVSLSTNHLERGEHVSAIVNQEKQKQYVLPLMQDIATAKLHPETSLGVHILDLPLENLPRWTSLPVFNLWGDVSSLERLRAAGFDRRENMSVCGGYEKNEDARHFLCPSDKVVHRFG